MPKILHYMEIGIGTLSLMHPDSGIERQAHPAAVYLLLLPRQAERMRRVFRPGSIWKETEGT